MRREWVVARRRSGSRADRCIFISAAPRRDVYDEGRGGERRWSTGGGETPVWNIHIYLGDIFLLATDKILSRYVSAGGAGDASSERRGTRVVTPEALAIIYQVPKTCFVVRFYCTNFREHCRFVSKFNGGLRTFVAFFIFTLLYKSSHFRRDYVKFVYEAFKCCTRDRCNRKVNVSKWHNF